MSKRVEIFGMPLDMGISREEALELIASDAALVSYINPFAWKTALRFPAYVAQLRALDLLVCDGVLVQRAVRSVFAIQTPILTPDLSGIGRAMLELWAKRQSRLCLVGGTEAVVSAAGSRILAEFPGIRLTGIYNGYGDSVAAARAHVLESAPDTLLVGMGMGRQEAFLCDVAAAGWSGVGVCVGAFFDRLAIPQLDYPDWSVKYNVRFLGNLGRRPAYYLRRYAVDYLPFLKHFAGHMVDRKKT